ncbi:hypothetical protein D3C72_2076960 [compost metagenome]
MTLESLGQGLRDDAWAIAQHRSELGGAFRVGEHVLDQAAFEAIGEFLAVEEGGGGDDDGSQLHAGEQDLPEGSDVGEHHQEAIAAPYPETAQEVGHLVGAAGELVKASGF